MAFDGFDLDLATASQDGAERLYVNLRTTLNTANVRTFKRNGRDKIAVRAACLEDNAVMNMLLYPADVIADALWSAEGCPVCWRHPEDEQGRWLSARSPDGLAMSFIGGSYENVERIQNSGNGNDPSKKRVWGDVVLDVATLRQTEHGKWVLSQIQAENPLSMSIGAYIDIVSAPTGADYKYVLVWMMMDHFAILQEGEEPASSVEDGTGMFVAARKEPVQLRMLACNLLTDENNLLTDAGGDGTSRNDAGSDPAPQDDEAMVHSILNWCRSRFTGGNSTTATEELGDMSDETKTEAETSANAEAEASTTETVTNSGSASGAAFTPEQETRIAEIVTNAVSEVAKPLIDAQTATNADAEAKATAHKAELVEKVVANNTLTAEVAEATPVETLEALVANSSDASGSAPVNGTGESANTAPSADSVANTLNGTKEAA